MRSLKFVSNAATLITLGILAIATPATAAKSCDSDRALLRADFEIHNPAEFDHLAAQTISKLTESGDNFVLDATGPIRSHYSHHVGETLKLFSYDDITTPQSTQYGDIAFFFVIDPSGKSEQRDPHLLRLSSRVSQPIVKQLVEVRWWDDGKRHAVYNADWVRCAASALPMAENTLY